jgi:subtilisin family serine protease
VKRLVLIVVTALAVSLLTASPGTASQRPVDREAVASSSIDPALARQMAAALPGEMLKAVLVLRSQADLSTIAAPSRAARIGATVRALRQRAAQTQAGLVSLLAQRRALGLVTRVQPLWIQNAIGVEATPAVLDELAARPEIRVIRPDLTVRAPVPTAATAALTSSALAEDNLTRINAPALWDNGFRGQGIVVASMDTGVDVSHPDLAGRWRGGTNSWYDPYGEHPTTPVDINGHGTQTMGVIVGGDAGGTAIGVAPDARWIAVKMFDDRGTATSTAIHLGYQWLLDPDHDPATADAPNVVNNSWTLSGGGCNLDFQQDLRSLRSAGILPVFAAGNFGPSSGTVFSPANNPEAVSVGDTDDTDTIDPFSSRGPSACAGTVAPKLTAPGVGIRTSDLFGGYVEETGTSLAAPHVTGALALLLSAAPGLSADRQEGALESGAADLGVPGADNDFGYGRLDALAAYTWLSVTPDFSVSVSPSTASTSPGGAVSFTVSVAPVNGFGGDVSLDIGGLPGTQASATFNPAVITGASGSSQLPVSTTSAIATGSYPLVITGTSGTTSHTTSATLLVVPPPDFSLSATPTSRNVTAGTATTYTVSVGSLNGFTGSVSLGLSGLPSNVGTSTFTPPSVSGSGTSQLSITTANTAPAGSYPLIIGGSAGTLTHAASVNLVVVAKNFALSASPSTLTINRGQTASFTVSVTTSGGFTGSVRLAVSGRPNASTTTWSRNPVATPGSSVLKVRTTGSTTRKTYTLVITGTSGSRSNQTTVTLVVR